jgi:ABC-type branched-subunit amino acid transport system ATPase component
MPPAEDGEFRYEIRSEREGHNRVALLVEHDIDRVFQLADAVTVMNDGHVLVDGTVEDARSSPSVQEVYIGSGTHALAGKSRPSAASLNRC